MDLFIHTLSAGTTFELRVSPFETICSIKAKVQKLEGIPISQQHLIWRSMELQDNFCLHDYGIKSGATLTLVLALRGGPINMRRVSLEEPSFQEMAEYIDENRGEFWDKLIDDNKQVTLLVYREGDQLNFYRVYDGSDGSMSPYADSVSAASAYNSREDKTPTTENKALQDENLIMKDKIRLLQQQIALKRSKKIIQPSRPSSKKIPSSNLSKRRIQFSKTLNKDSLQDSSPKVDSYSDLKLNNNDDQVISSLNTMHIEGEINDTTRNLLPPINNTKGRNAKKSDFNDETSSCFKGNDSSSSLDRSKSVTNVNSEMKKNKRLPEIHNTRLTPYMPSIAGSDSLCKPAHSKRHSLIKPLGSVDKNNSNKLLKHIIKPPSPARKDLQDSQELLEKIPCKNKVDKHLDKHLHRCQIPDVDPMTYENYNKLGHQRKSKDMTNEIDIYNEKEVQEHDTSLKTKIRKNRKTSSRLSSSKLHTQNNLQLPPVNNYHRNLPNVSEKKKKPRCKICTKKLGLATTYECRCGSKFCAKHRYPETHTCTFDYKAEGRRLLERSNPVITAPKLPKI